MKISCRVIVIIIYAALSLIVFNRPNSFINHLILTFLTSCIVVFVYLLTLHKIKTGRIIKIGKNRSAKWFSLTWFFVGIFFVVIAYQLEYDLNVFIRESNFMPTWLMFFILSLLHYENFIVLFRNKSVQFKGGGVWSYKTIDKILIRDANIEIDRDVDKEQIELGTVDLKQINHIIDYLKPRLGDKLFVYENTERTH